MFNSLQKDAGIEWHHLIGGIRSFSLTVRTAHPPHSSIQNATLDLPRNWSRDISHLVFRRMRCMDPCCASSGSSDVTCQPLCACARVMDGVASGCACARTPDVDGWLLWNVVVCFYNAESLFVLLPNRNDVILSSYAAVCWIHTHLIFVYDGHYISRSSLTSKRINENLSFLVRYWSYLKVKIAISFSALVVLLPEQECL